MTLRRRTLTLVALTLAGLLAVLTLLTHGLLGRGFLQLEHDEARRDLQRALTAFQDDLAQLGATVEDYAAWDRMVEFAEGRERAQLSSEFVPLTLQNLRLHGVVILDGHGRPFFTYGLDPDTARVTAAPPELLEEVEQADGPLLLRTGQTGEAAGVLPAKRYPLLVSSHAIVTSEGRGPSRGTVMFARYFTAAAERKLAAVTHLSVRVAAVSRPDLPPDILGALREIAAGTPEIVHPLDEERVASYAAIPSVRGQPALAVRVDSPRSVVRQGRATLGYLVVALLGVGLAFTTLMVGVIEWSVLSPLSRVRQGVDRVAASGDLTVRMPEVGPNEFAALAATMNSMLSALERSDRDLREAREAALQASQAKSEFIANVSHEIRTPMNGVVGMVELLARTPLTPRQRRCLETVRGSADALLQILNDVLDLSKIEAGRFSLSAAPTDIAAVVKQAAEVFVGRAQAKGVALVVHREPDVPRLVACDAVRVRQIVLNLVGNAVKFTDRGFVRVDLGATPAPGRPAVVALTVAVRDTGCGIDAGQIDRVFDKFVQTEQARHIGGTGLGLTISRQLAVLMGGDIQVESVPGKGSTFRLVFEAAVVDGPAAIGRETADASPTGSPASVPAEPRLAGVRVLVAEDNPVGQQVARLMLEGLGCQVDLVGDGEAAVQKAREGVYDAVLLDCRMPRLDGRAAASAIRTLGGRWRDIPIIAVTADVLEGERERCLAAGMSAVVTKPLRWNDLREALEVGITRRAPAPGATACTERAGAGEVIDWTALARLSRLRQPGDSDPVAHLITLFLEDAPPRLAEMERAAASGDFRPLAEAAHALKGSCGTVGAVELRAVCAAAESAARAGGRDRGNLCGQARAAFERAERLLRQRLTEGDRAACPGNVNATT